MQNWNRNFEQNCFIIRKNASIMSKELRDCVINVSFDNDKNAMSVKCERAALWSVDAEPRCLRAQLIKALLDQETGQNGAALLLSDTLRVYLFYYSFLLGDESWGRMQDDKLWGLGGATRPLFLVQCLCVRCVPLPASLSLIVARRRCSWARDAESLLYHSTSRYSSFVAKEKLPFWIPTNYNAFVLKSRNIFLHNHKASR